MKIGIDLKDLQSFSAYRGIGEATKQVTNNLLPLLGNNPDGIEVVFFMYDMKQDDVLKMITIPDNLNYSVRYYNPENLNLNKFARLKRALLPTKVDQDADEMDVFLSFSIIGYVPKARNVFLVWYDAITLVLYRIYFLRNKTDSISLFLRNNQLFRSFIFLIIKARMQKKMQRAKRLIAISQYTKDDVAKIFPGLNIPIDVALLGVSETPSKTVNTVDDTLPEKPYLLFIGGIDPKREIASLIEQYNQLKQNGHDFQLVLAGKSFEHIDKIESQDVKEAILESPYRDDIITVGYISDEYKSELYSHALAFVYPTLYEGFGLPVLEAMLAKTLVLTYDNSSLPEVGGRYAFYVNSSNEIASKVLEIESLSDSERQKIIEQSYNHAKQFTWAKTAQKFYDILMTGDQQN
ncbi:MAG: glycosyltransferase family 4 protein [Lactobacillaceae bacterium]|jgi:glycosyltransferase involved in cell wall biosynthesis|nr:glycosyltransferase family 4 protein [Lactobacillaceae bacterium]